MIRYYEYEDIDLAFDKYVLEGGLSGSYLYKTDEDKYNYISEVEYRYYKVEFKLGYADYSTYVRIYYLYLTIDETLKTGSINNLMQIENTGEISNNQRVLMQAPTGLDSTKEGYYLNNIPIDTVLTSEAYYELLYKNEDNKFYAKGVRA